MKMFRLMIDFLDEESLAEFVRLGKRLSILEEKAAVYHAESLDFIPSRGGVGRKHTFILRSKDQVGRKRMKVSRDEEV